jgi:hypothetical protein
VTMALAIVLTRVAVTAVRAARLTGTIPRPGTTQPPRSATATHRHGHAY